MRIPFFFLPTLLAILLSGCGEKRSERHYDAGALLKQHCERCHNLDMPPKTSADEAAPPIMAVTFHIRDFLNVDNPAERRPGFIAFVADYALHPAAEKSFCDEASLKEYGVMPSLEGMISAPELEAVAAYMYDTYTKDAFLKRMEEANAFARLPAGEQLAHREGCFGCHDTTLQKVGPTFTAIAGRYKDADTIIQSIRSGSRGKWEISRNIPMPARRDLNASQIERLAAWILGLND